MFSSNGKIADNHIHYKLEEINSILEIEYALEHTKVEMDLRIYAQWVAWRIYQQ